MSDEPLIGREAQDRRDRELIEAARDQIDGPGGPAEMNDRSSSAASSSAGGWRPDDLPRDSLPGYEILDEIHRGGQGVVYLAVQKATQRQVAVKVMRQGPFSGRHDKIRFEREIHVLGQLQHPNIVAIHDSGMAGGHFYFVMDYIAGQPLDEYVADAARISARAGVEGRGARPAGGLSVREVLRLFATICQAVHAAHLRGVIHRDLKPSNIRIDAEGRPQVLDFGLARMVHDQTSEEEAPQAMTVTGQFVGSMPWASPEQAEGVPGKLDVRTDVYSLGVVLYQLLTGRFPYNVVGPMREVLDRIVSHEPARPSTICRQIDGEVETIVLKCLAKQRERRYQSAGELARDIGHYLAGEPIEARRDSTWYVVRKHLRRHVVPLVAAGVLVAVLVASSVLAWGLYMAADRAHHLADERTIEAEQRLWESYLAGARAQRVSRRPGQRLNSLDVLAKAAAIRPALELRNEAVACMALVDVETIRQLSKPAPGWDRVAIESNLDRCALADMGGNVSIRLLDGDQEVALLPGFGKRIWAAEFSPDGQFLLVHYDTDRYRLWDVTGSRCMIETPLGQSFSAACFSLDGQLVAMTRSDGTSFIYSATTGQEPKRLPPGVEACGMAFHPDGTKLALSRRGGSEVLIRRVDDGTVIQKLPHPDMVRGVAWSPDGELLAVGCANSRLYVWEAASGRMHADLAGHQKVVGGVGFHSSGRVLVSNSWDGTSCLWDPWAGELLLRVPYTLAAGRRDGWFLGWNEAGTGLNSVTGLIDGGEFDRLHGHVGAKELGLPDISPDGRWLAAPNGDGLTVWSLRTRAEVAHLPVESVQASFDPQSGDLFTCGPKGLHRWPIRDRTANGEPKATIGPPQLLWVEPTLKYIGFSADGERLAVRAGEEKILLLDTRTARITRTIAAGERLDRVVLSPDGRLVGAGSWHASGIRVWDVATGQLVKHLLPEAINAAMLFSPDGKRLLTFTPVEYCRWDTGSWQPVHRVPRTHTGSFQGHAAFSRDGRLLAITPSEYTIRLLNAATCEELATFEPPQQYAVNGLCFDPTGTQLAVANAACDEIHIWDLRRIRERLASMNLDWNLPPYPAEHEAGQPDAMEVEVIGADAPSKPLQTQPATMPDGSGSAGMRSGS